MTGMEKIAEQNFPDIIPELHTRPLPDTPLKVAISIFTYLHKHKSFIKAALGLKGDLNFQTRIKDVMWKTLTKNNPKALIQEENLLVPSTYLVSYIASAHIGVIQNWLNNDCKESPQEMARILSMMTVNGSPYAAGLKPLP
jgi:hypothetical protein